MTDLQTLREKMENTLTAFHKDLSGLRTGRASVNLVDNVQVEVYGSLMPLNQVATVSVPEARMITLQVWDKANVSAVEKAIMNADLGLNPSSDGQLVRLPIPDLTEERRKEMAKIAGTYAEKARIAIRNVRRDGMESLKKSEKNGEISEDELHTESDNVQKLTDEYISKVDTDFKEKEKDIMTI